MPETRDINLVELVDRFRDEDVCREYLEKLRWPAGVGCPRCGDTSVSEIETRGQYDCNSCRYRFSVTSGTVLHDTKLPLWKWFVAVYLMCEAKKGISAAQLGRTIGVSYKTAWYLCHRVRSAVGSDGGPSLRGLVEIDETWIGGKRHGVGKGSKEGKTAVIGAVERGGKVRLQVIHARDRKTLHAFVEEHVEDEAEAIFTDEWPAYLGIADENTRHETVTHSEGEWVNGLVHTNTAESVWSLLKRSIIGAYHKVSKKHLEAYLDELEWRFSNRRNPFLFRDTLKRMIEGDTLHYSELTA